MRPGRQTPPAALIGEEPLARHGAEGRQHALVADPAVHHLLPDHPIQRGLVFQSLSHSEIDSVGERAPATPVVSISPPEQPNSVIVFLVYPKHIRADAD